MSPAESVDTPIVLFNGKITTMDPARPEVGACLIEGGRFSAVGEKDELLRAAPKNARRVDLQGRRAIPGLIDSHMHVIRGGLNYNLELRWDGVRSLAVAMDMLKKQVLATPAPLWVRVVGGFTEMQFAERRLPTLDELNAVAPATPVFILHLYDRALLNRAALRACGYTKATPNPPGGELARDASGEPTGLLLARPNAYILYATLAKGPKLPAEYQENSTRHFMRELNRLGVTGVIDAGGGFQNYPEDYSVIQKLAEQRQLTVRVAYNLFTQNAGGEASDFRKWTSSVPLRQGDDYLRHNGAGEMLVFSAADFEDFRVERPEMPVTMEASLEEVVRILAERGWPWRLHATYDETISRALDVFERVHRDIPISNLRWFFDHAETISDRNIDRVGKLGGGIAVQDRMAFQGEYFVERYGREAARRAPPIREMLAAGVVVGAGTDATRVASYNPWLSLAWLVTGKTIGGEPLRGDGGLDRELALRLWTKANTWFSSDEGRGAIAVGQHADLVALSDDYFAVEESAIDRIESVLTIVGGTIVHGAKEFSPMAPPLPPAMPDWSPARTFGGYGGLAASAPVVQASSCAVHREGQRPRGARAPSDDRTFWGALGCSCWAF
ncbi:MAG: amidohydrolase [Polyangiaceae bacterium]